MFLIISECNVNWATHVLGMVVFWLSSHALRVLSCFNPFAPLNMTQDFFAFEFLELLFSFSVFFLVDSL